MDTNGAFFLLFRCINYDAVCPSYHDLAVLYLVLALVLEPRVLVLESILSSCELSVIGPIFLAIFSQYCVEYLSIIGSILLASWGRTGHFLHYKRCKRFSGGVQKRSADNDTKQQGRSRQGSGKWDGVSSRPAD